MNALDRVIAALSPRAGLRRAQARTALESLANYRAASIPRRSGSVRAVSGDADAVATQARRQIMLAARDVIRNNGTAERAVQVIVNNVVGTGIEPKLVTKNENLIERWGGWSRYLNSIDVDADRLSTLAALQRLAIRTTVIDGESLVLFPRDQRPDQPFFVKVLEIDYLDERLNGKVGAAPGNTIYDGIEYDSQDRVVAYHLYDDHPGSVMWKPDWRGLTSTRVEASRVIHLYRVDRPGQRRGISWLAPVLDDLVALADNDEAQLTRQKIAACFAAFWHTEKTPDQADIPLKLAPGLIQKIGTDDDVTMADPPQVTGYEDFAKVHLRRIAAGLGITYESLTNDLSGWNFSSGRIGRVEMGQNVEGWQWTMVIPRLCDPMAKWFLQSQVYLEPSLVSVLRDGRIDWTPPPPVIADPKSEIQTAVAKIEAGLSGRHSEIRKLGYDPDDIDKEIGADMETRRSLSALKAPAVAAAQDGERELNA